MELYNSVDDCKNFLFVIEGEQYQASRFYSVFKSKMIEATGLDLSASQYRHIAIAFMQKNLQIYNLVVFVFLYLLFL